mmetsp:Transcript_96267/g.201128  ORF Transcript_96267/g.201128 Transcript_96267/m.201128 type:complete len:316 (+) Transcript_96267:29-976(+)
MVTRLLCPHLCLPWPSRTRDNGSALVQVIQHLKPASQFVGEKALEASQVVAKWAVDRGSVLGKQALAKGHDAAIQSWPHIMDAADGARHVTLQAGAAAADLTQRVVHDGVTMIKGCMNPIEEHSEWESTDDEESEGETHGSSASSGSAPAPKQVGLEPPAGLKLPWKAPWEQPLQPLGPMLLTNPRQSAATAAVAGPFVQKWNATPSAGALPTTPNLMSGPLTSRAVVPVTQWAGNGAVGTRRAASAVVTPGTFSRAYPPRATSWTHPNRVTVASAPGSQTIVQPATSSSSSVPAAAATPVPTTTSAIATPVASQ